ncbi:hypothetical protein EGI22_15350, partial [Lacihabitans sp. LS3-19]|uniref:hypothetical protein n=1 Tax=Lacihabitans sp. LS3-19 TaxID=2487335 RepID=UPI0020CF30D6
TTGIFNNLAAGNYTVWVKNNSGCISDTSKAVILPQPNSPTKPILATIQPTCTVATGKISVSSPTGVGMSYSLDGLSFTNTTGIFNNLAAGNYSVWVKNTLGCISQSASGIINTQPIKPDAGLDKVIYLPISSTVLTPNPLGGTWAVSTGNIFSSSINNSGTVSGLNNAGGYNFVYSLNTCSDTAKVTVICTKPTLTLGNIKCEGSTYSVAFYSSTPNISPSAGTISGDRIINIPTGTNLSVKASNGTGCETVLDVISPEPCDSSCEFSNL